ADVMSYSNGVGDTLTITWYIKIDWDHDVLIDTDILQFVSDGTDSASNYFETNWNFETRLDYSTSPYLSDDRGDINTSDLIGSGSVTYYGSSHSPLANETDVWIVRDGVETWSGDLSVGSFSISGIGSLATTGLNNYTFKVVAEGSGSGGTDLYYTTSLIDTFITDRIEIYEADVVDGRININSDCEVWWRARYEYDGTPIQSGLILDLNGSRTLIWDAGGLYWIWQETSVSPSSAWFEVASASESNYGLTEWFATTSVQQVIWDALIITITDPSDQRVDVGTNATGIIVSAVYSFDSTVFDGVFTLNNTNYQYASPQIQWYSVSTASGDTHGISAIQTNDATFCIWDRVLVVSVTVDDPYHDPGDNARITVELEYEFDNTQVLAGTFDISGYSLTHAGSGRWEVLVTIGTYSDIDFDDLTSCDATLHGISGYNMDSNAVTVYWDRIEFYSVTVDDERINIGTSAEIQWSARLENAGVDIPTGIVVSMTGDIVCIPSGGVYVASVSQSTVGSVTYSIITASLGEIEQFTQTTADATVIWDRVKLTSITTGTPSVDAGVSVEIRVTLVYEFDDTPVTDGTIYLNNGPFAMTYNSAGYWSASVSQTLAGSYTFTVDSVSGNTHGISILNTDDLTMEIEWVEVPGFVLDTMTLMIIGGGAGIALIGAAIVASRRRRGPIALDVGEIDTSSLGIPEVVEDVPPEEPVSVEIEEEPTSDLEVEPEEIEPSEPEVEDSEVESEIVDEAVEPETEEVELPPMEEELADVEEFEIETEAEIPDETTIEPEIEVEAEEIIEEHEIPEIEDQIPEEIVEPEPEVAEEADVVEMIEEPVEPEIEPEVEDYIPEEFIEPAPKLDLSNLTKKELLDLIPDDIKKSTPPSELKRLTKSELISLVESFLDVDE
ncbi:MAG: hypothetical protein ACFFDM_08855, partial [Candidatus Thorarchaeota archaeon]